MNKTEELNNGNNQISGELKCYYLWFILVTVELTFAPAQLSVFQNDYFWDISAQLFLLMLSLAMEDRKNTAQKTFSRQVTARTDAFIHG